MKKWEKKNISFVFLLHFLCFPSSLFVVTYSDFEHEPLAVVLGLKGV